MSEEVMAASAAGTAAAPKHVTPRLISAGSASTRAMREQAVRRREAEAKLQQHLLQTRGRQATGGMVES
jgi:hypothetical protein